MESVLFLDIYETALPSIVREVLDQEPNIKHHLCTSFTPTKKCFLVVSNSMFFWDYSVLKDGIPRAFKLLLPSTGLKYTPNLICVFTKAKSNNIGIIGVSPEGTLRYWPDINKPYQDEPILMNNEVAHSIRKISSQDKYNKFVVTTWTGNIYVVKIFDNHHGDIQIDIRFVDTAQSSGIKNRVSKLFFGSSNLGKEQILKTICVRNSRIISGVDVMLALQKSLRFYSLESQSLVGEIDLIALTLAELKKNNPKSASIVEKISLLDTVLYQKGFLLLISVVKNQVVTRGARSFYLAYLDGQFNFGDPLKFEIMKQVIIPSPMADSLKSVHGTLHSVNNKQCIIVFQKSIILINEPISQNSETLFLESVGDQIIGSASVDNDCYLFLKSGIFTLRRLPRSYDLKFWNKFGSRIIDLFSTHYQDNTSYDALFFQAFIKFSSKELDKAKETINYLLNQFEVNFSQLSLGLLNIIFNSSSESVAFLKNNEIDYKHILKHLSNKIFCYKMIVLFIRYFELLEKLNVPIEHGEMVTGIGILAEYVISLGEALISMVFTANFLMNSINKCHTINTIMNSFRREASSDDTDCLSSIFSQLSKWHKFLPMSIKSSEKILENTTDMQARKKIIIEVGSLLSNVVEGIFESMKEEWSIVMPGNTERAAIALNHLPFLTGLVIHLNKMLNILETEKESTSDNEELLQCSLTMAKFILSQQNSSQRSGSDIIAKFYASGNEKVALELAEKYQDFSLIVKHCHNIADTISRDNEIERYKEMFRNDNFDIFLYEFYRNKGMVGSLIAEKGDRVMHFLSSHKNILWIKNIQDGDYKNARQVLQLLSTNEQDPKKKLIKLSLCKLCALCENSTEENIGEIAELSHNIRMLHGIETG